MNTLQKTLAIGRRGNLWAGAVVVPLLFLSGCATNTGTGALAGAGIGAGLGAVIGHVTHNTAAGAVVGAAAGSVVGAAVGSSVDESQRRTAIQQDVAARGGPLSLEQIRDLTHNNVGDALIIDQIRATRTVFQLTPEQIVWLKQEGVSEAVIHEMEMTAYRGPRRVYVAEPVVQPVIGVGYGYGWRRY